MSLVVGDISVSLDGYVTAPGADVEHGLGVDGEPIHRWVSEATPVDAEILRRSTASTGAVVMGRNLFDVVDAPQGWTDEMGYGATQAGTPPFYVVTSTPPDHVRLNLDFEFVTAGLRPAIERARAAAGEKDVVVMGGAMTVRGALDAGLLDRLVLHVSPIVTAGGTSLFDGAQRTELTQIAVVPSERAVHITYAVDGDGHEVARR